MTSIIDDKGYNQGFKRTKTFKIRIERRAKMMINQMDQLTTNSKILEIGCGTCQFAPYLGLSKLYVPTDIILKYLINKNSS